MLVTGGVIANDPAARESAEDIARRSTQAIQNIATDTSRGARYIASGDWLPPEQGFFPLPPQEGQAVRLGPDLVEGCWNSPEGFDLGQVNVDDWLRLGPGLASPRFEPNHGYPLGEQLGGRVLSFDPTGPRMVLGVGKKQYTQWYRMGLIGEMWQGVTPNESNFPGMFGEALSNASGIDFHIDRVDPTEAYHQGNSIQPNKAGYGFTAWELYAIINYGLLPGTTFYEGNQRLQGRKLEEWHEELRDAGFNVP